MTDPRIDDIVIAREKPAQEAAAMPDVAGLERWVTWHRVP